MLDHTTQDHVEVVEVEDIAADTLQATEEAAADSPLSIRQILMAGLGFTIFLTVLTVGINAIGVENLQQFIVDAGPLAPLVYILIKAATYVFAPLTSGPIQVIAGTIFGNVWLGVLYTLIGEVIGGSISFWIARKLGRPVVERFVGESGMRQVDNFYQNQLGGWKSLAVARVVLFSLWDFLSYAAGLAKSVRFTSYVAVSAILGVIPTFAFVWIGERAVGDSSALIWIYGLVAVLILVPVLLRKQIGQLLVWANNGGIKRK